MLQIGGNASLLSARRRLTDRSSGQVALRILTLTAEDLPLIAQFLLETDRQTRASRFGSMMSDKALLSYAAGALMRTRLLLGLFVDSKLHGLLEAHDCGDRRREVALTVARAFRRKGFATALLREAIAQADQDVSTYRLIFAPGNWAMRRIAQKTDAQLDLVLGEFCADIDLTRRDR
jgi:ribosomal protein S18 acetylase RimI-like enzyme